jgi:hypothetical protein
MTDERVLAGLFGGMMAGSLLGWLAPALVCLVIIVLLSGLYFWPWLRRLPRWRHWRRARRYAAARGWTKAELEQLIVGNGKPGQRQCRAMTLQGQQCKRIGAGDYCHQHQVAVVS